MAGLFGLGGIGGAQPPAGLLGPYFNPADMRKQQLKQGLLAAGIGLLTGGKGSTGEVLGQGLAAGLQGANNAGINYKQDAMGYQQLEMQMQEQRQKEEERQKKEAAVAKMVESAPENMKALWAAYPELGAKAFYEMNKGPEPTDDMREYEMAKQQGYQGTLRDYMIEMKKSGATSVNVNGDTKLTEGQSKDLGFYSRGIYANADLGNLENSLVDLGGNVAGKMGVVGNYFKDPKYRQAERAGREFLAVVLRKDTGAAVTPAEFELYGPMYLPWPGDDKQTISDKKVARERAMQGIRLGGGTARPLFEDIDSEFKTYAPPVNEAPRLPNTGVGGKTSTGVPWSVQ